VNVSIRINELFEEIFVSPIFIHTVGCEWESLEQELEHDNAEREDLHLIDVFNSLINILLGCHVSGGPSVIDDVFSLRKVCFVAKIT
jgi:hypothetical protein